MSSSRAKRKRRQRARAARAGQAGGAKGPGDAARGASSKGARSAPRATRADRSAASAAGASAGWGARAAARIAVAAGGGARVEAIPPTKPLWAPFPLTEVAMAAGIVMLGLGLENGRAEVMAIGAVVLAVAVAELCLREHFAGFRSHAVLLAALAVVAAHSAVALLVTDAYAGPAALALDLVAGGALWWWLRRRFDLVRARRLARPRRGV